MDGPQIDIHINTFASEELPIKQNDSDKWPNIINLSSNNTSEMQFTNK